MAYNVLIVVEIPERERLAFLALKAFLEMEGLHVAMCSTTDIRGNIRSFAPDIIVWNVATRASEYYPYFYFYGKKDFKLVNMYFEQSRHLEGFSKGRIKPPFDKYFVDKWICYSEKVRELLRSVGVPEDRLAVAGHYRFALPFLVNKFLDRSALKGYLLGDKAAYEKTVLFCPSFELAHIDSAGTRKMERMFGISWFMDYVKWARLMEDYYVQGIEMSGKKHKDMLFIVRPHPFKSMVCRDYYRERFKALENVYVEERGDISFWVNIADLLVGNRTGATIDACVVDLPVIGLKPEKGIREDDAWFGTSYDSLTAKYSIEDMCGALPELVKPGNGAGKRSAVCDVFNGWGIKDIENAYARIADYIKGMSGEDAVKKPHSLFQDIFWASWKNRQRLNPFALIRKTAGTLWRSAEPRTEPRERTDIDFGEIERELVQKIKAERKGGKRLVGCAD